MDSRSVRRSSLALYPITSYRAVPCRCLIPTSVGLVVARRVRITFSVPVRVPVAFDVFGNPVEFVEADPEVAGQWDPRCWRDHP